MKSRSHTIRMAMLLLLLATTILSSACSMYQVRRSTYDVLRQEDCRRNDSDNFCTRSFVFEFDVYENLRNTYIYGSDTTKFDTYRVTLDF